ncbi:MAG TPA: alpha/beta hydrolase-fold protein [Gemmataceae bacterium]|jgi:hypothetical protein
MRFPVTASLLLLVVLVWGRAAAAPLQTSLRFEVTVARGLLSAPQDGRLLLVLDRKKRPEPRRAIGQTGRKAPPILGRDVRGFAPGVSAALDQTAIVSPLEHLAELPKGDYFVQAVFMVNRDLQLIDAPGNLYSEPLAVKLDPQRGGTVKIELTRAVPPEALPAEDGYVKYVKIRSELLSKFHGRPMYLRAGVILPRDYERERERRYPLRVHIGGYGTRFTAVRAMMHEDSSFRKTWLTGDTPRMILLHLDGAGPYGDPYQVNSANNGPYGDAVTQELIPYVERKFRAVGRPYARVLDGASTGGWVALALQIFYADYFNGAWSDAPDPVDFRAYELLNIYEHENAYVNERGFERPASRERNGDVRYTVRHECRVERVLGRGDRWELSGKDWGAWNATFGPRGHDGLPRPLWDGATGKIDREVIEHWKQYDLRLVLRTNWKTLAPKLRGKLRIWVGESDEFFLNNAVHLLDAFLREAQPPFEGRITFAIGRGHEQGLSEKQMMAEMAATIARGKAAAQP